VELAFPILFSSFIDLELFCFFEERKPGEHVLSLFHMDDALNPSVEDTINRDPKREKPLTGELILENISKVNTQQKFYCGSTVGASRKIYNYFYRSGENIFVSLCKAKSLNLFFSKIANIIS